MSWATAFVIVGLALAFLGTLSFAGYSRLQHDQTIAVECVRSGGQWVSHWNVYECVRGAK